MYTQARQPWNTLRVQLSAYIEAEDSYLVDPGIPNDPYLVEAFASLGLEVDKTWTRYTTPFRYCNDDQVPNDLGSEEFLLSADCCCSWRWRLRIGEGGSPWGTAEYRVTASQAGSAGDPDWTCIATGGTTSAVDGDAAWASVDKDITGELAMKGCACGKDNIGGAPAVDSSWAFESEPECWDISFYEDPETEEIIEVLTYIGSPDGVYRGGTAIYWGVGFPYVSCFKSSLGAEVNGSGDFDLPGGEGTLSEGGGYTLVVPVTLYPPTIYTPNPSYVAPDPVEADMTITLFTV